MKAVFADTFYWIALTAPRDASRERAVAVTSNLAASAVPIVTTEEILAEYLTFFAETTASARERVVRNVERLQIERGVRIVWQSHDSDRHFEQECFRALFRD